MVSPSYGRPSLPRVSGLVRRYRRWAGDGRRLKLMLCKCYLRVATAQGDERLNLNRDQLSYSVNRGMHAEWAQYT